MLKHYLKGSLRCDRCHQAGRVRRLIYTEAKGRSGEHYGYFLCRGRQLKECDLPHLPAQQVEERITDYYRTLQLDLDYREQFTTALETALADQQATTRELDRTLRAEYAKLSEQEDRLIDALASGTLSASKLQERIATIKRRQALIQERITHTTRDLEAGAGVLRQILITCDDPHQLYATATDDARGLLNKALFHALYLSDHGVVTDAEPSELLAPIQRSQHEWRRLSAETEATPETSASKPSSSTTKPATRRSQAQTRKQRSVFDEALRAMFPDAVEPGIDVVNGSSTAIMVELRGLEPLTPSMRTRCATSCATAPGALQARRALVRVSPACGAARRYCDGRPRTSSRPARPRIKPAPREPTAGCGIPTSPHPRRRPPGPDHRATNHPLSIDGSEDVRQAANVRRSSPSAAASRGSRWPGRWRTRRRSAPRCARPGR